MSAKTGSLSEECSESSSSPPSVSTSSDLTPGEGLFGSCTAHSSCSEQWGSEKEERGGERGRGRGGERGRGRGGEGEEEGGEEGEEEGGEEGEEEGGEEGEEEGGEEGGSSGVGVSHVMGWTLVPPHWTPTGW